MNIKEINDKITDKAWSDLYKRFEKDGLLPDVGTKPKQSTLRSTSLKWIAIAAVACICILSVLAIRQLSISKTDMLTLRNDENAPTLVTMLEDGSVVYLSQYTSLEYPSHFQEKKREVMLQGDAFFEISKNRERPFFVDTESAMIEVLGTAFCVVSKNNIPFSLSVKEGEVKVTLKKNKQIVYVKAGEMVLLESGSLHKTRSTNSKQFDEYMRQIHFKDERLADIIRIINMNSTSIQLQITPSLQDRMLTTAFVNDTPETMTKLICLALNLKYTQQGNVITISEP